MPFNKATLKASISLALSTTRDPSLSISAYCDLVANDIANAVDTYVLAGLATVAVTGTATGALAGGPGVPVTGTLSWLD